MESTTISMDFTIISLALTSFTALAAVIGPIISSIITVRSNERTKKCELYSPRVYDAVHKFTEAYAKLPRKADYDNGSDYRRHELALEYLSAFKDFAHAGYEVMSYLPNDEIHDQIVALIGILDGRRWIGPDHDKDFQKLAAVLALELASEVSPNKKRIARKTKMKGRK